jgi:hypothetical protein
MSSISPTTQIGVTMVAPISFIALVAVGAHYNLLLAMRIREGAQAGLGASIGLAYVGPRIAAVQPLTLRLVPPR